MTLVDVDWGPSGLRRLAADADVVVIVDVLSFTTAVDVALGRDAVVLPYRWHDGKETDYAAAHRAEIGPLSPSRLADVEPATRLVIPSPNGSALSFGAAEAGARNVVAGCLRNAPAVGAWVARRGERIAVLAAGERWHGETGPLRPAVEDLLGAGALVDAMGDVELTAEARAARAAFRDAGGDLQTLLHTSVSGREKEGRSEGGDVDLAAEHGVSEAVPVLDGPEFRDVRKPAAAVPE